MGGASTCAEKSLFCSTGSSKLDFKAFSVLVHEKSSSLSFDFKILQQIVPYDIQQILKFPISY